MIESILYNNYGKETMNNFDKANHFVRIPISSLINENIYRVPNIKRMVWVLKIPNKKHARARGLNLQHVNAEISCVDCNGKGHFLCANCAYDGQRITFIGCDQCDSTGKFGYNQCRDCDGTGKIDFICAGRRCQRGKISKPCRQCHGIPGSEFYCDCCYGKGYFWTKCDYCNGRWKVPNFDDCSKCYGTGNFNWRHTEQCNKCNGAGRNQVLVKCDVCDGKGKLSCDKCNDSGVVKIV